MGERKRIKKMPNRGGLSKHLNPEFPKTEWTAEKWAFILHRLTGIYIAAYLLAHIWVTGHATSPGSWESIMSTLHTYRWLETTGEWILWGAVVFHGLNGIRLILVEALGWGIGRPHRPIPPYTPYSNTGLQRPLLWLVVALTLIAWIVGGIILYKDVGLITW